MVSTRSHMLPFDCVYAIQSFLPFRDAVTTVSRAWLTAALRRFDSYRPRSWRNRLRLYSYRSLSGASDTYWQFFCRQVLGRTKRKRNDDDQLTWKAAADAYMSDGSWHCRACGHPTVSDVFGVRLCITCRQNPYLKHAFMVKVYQARRVASRKQLAPIPYHGGPMNGHWRFWTDVVAAVPDLEDSMTIRYHIG